jgi:hypothetical protein
MSPSEFDLRAALRDGEGDGVDPDRIIRNAQVARGIRRDHLVRSASIAAVVTVVAGLGVGAGLVLHHDGSQEAGSSAGGAADRAASAPMASSVNGVPAGGVNQGTNSPGASGSHGTISGPVAPGPLHDAAQIPCPTVLPRLTVGNAGSGPLFSGPVEAIKVCAYSTGDGALLGTGAAPASMIYAGQTADDIVAGIESAATEPARVPCPQYRLATGRTLVIIGVTPTGTAMTAITVQVDQNPCNVPITNGSAVRYNWQPPKVMTPFLSSLTGSGLSVDPGKASGSPLH